MIKVLKETAPKARKNHDCMASDFILAQGVDGFGYSFTELRVIAKAKRNHYKILKGETYLKQANIYEGKAYTFKAIPEMHEICIAHDLYY